MSSLEVILIHLLYLYTGRLAIVIANGASLVREYTVTLGTVLQTEHIKVFRY